MPVKSLQTVQGLALTGLQILMFIRDFIPDSGRLLHLQPPSVNTDVRIDAGFVAGDEVSSHYDPMIAKLIVRGDSRELAIQKLHAALSEYQIAGLTTNIDFLKRVCECPAFVEADLETGFITKNKDSLFRENQIPPEAYAQAAIGTYLAENASSSQNLPQNGIQAGFLASTQSRDFRFVKHSSTAATDQGETAIKVKDKGRGFFDVVVGNSTYSSIASRWDSVTKTITSYFPHTRLETRLIADENNITMFQQGQQYQLRLATPSWVEKALGLKDNAHSVLAPMPCKILRVEVEAGATVKKEQPLVVIESMKMETVIRSPQDGVVSRVVHGTGVSSISSKSGLWLIECRIFARLERLLLSLSSLERNPDLVLMPWDGNKTSCQSNRSWCLFWSISDVNIKHNRSHATI